MSTPKTPEQTPPVVIQYSKDEDFLSRYANNAQMESTSWDLKIIFGQTDVQAGPQAVVQHTAITVPWSYAKVLMYFLQAHVAGREAEEGKISVPKGIVSPPPTELPKELEAKLKHPKEGLEVIHKLYNEFIAVNPEAKT